MRSRDELNEELIEAIINNDLEAIDGLIAEGANLNDALILAADKKDAEALHHLIDVGVDPTEMLLSAAQENDSETIYMLADAGADLDSAFLIATAQNDYQTALTLIDAGANINTFDENGVTILHRAIAGSNPQLINDLLKRGADIYAKDPSSSKKTKTPEEISAILVKRIKDGIAKGKKSSLDTPENREICQLIHDHHVFLTASMHSQIIEFIKAMGYVSNDGGVCYGIAAMGMQAAMLGPKDVELYNARINRIAELCSRHCTVQEKDGRKKIVLNSEFVKLLKDIQNPEITLQQREELAKKIGITNKEYLDLQAYTQSVDLYFQSQKYTDENPGLFAKENTPKTQNIETASTLLWARNDKGKSLKTAGSITTVSSGDDTIELLETIRSAIQAHHDQPVGMIVGNAGHATSISYDPVSDNWIIIDANQADRDSDDKVRLLRTIPGNNTDEVAEFITRGLKAQQPIPINFHILVEGKMDEPLPTPKFMEAINQSDAQAKCMRSVEEAWDNPEDIPTIAILAIKTNGLETLRTLFDSPKAPNPLSDFLNSPNELGLTLMHRCAGTDKLEFIKLLIEYGADIHLRDREGFTAIFHAIGEGNLDSARELIRSGAGIEQTGPNGTPLIHYAIIGGHPEAVKLLLKHGVNLNSTDADGKKPLDYAIESGNKEIIEMIATRVLHTAVINDDVNTVFRLVMLADAPDIAKKPDSDGNTPLHFAASDNLTDVADMLLTIDLDVNVANRHGQTPLHFAVNAQSEDSIQFDTILLLLDHGADILKPDKEGNTPLDYADDAPEIKKLLATALLLQAAERGDMEAFKSALDAGAELDACDKNGYTALHLAANAGQLDMMQQLLTAGASVAAQDPDGYTPLHCAALSGNSDATKLLIQHGADVSCKNKAGETPLHIAKTEMNEAFQTHSDTQKAGFTECCAHLAAAAHKAAPQAERSADMTRPGSTRAR